MSAPGIEAEVGVRVQNTCKGSVLERAPAVGCDDSGVDSDSLLAQLMCG